MESAWERDPDGAQPLEAITARNVIDAMDGVAYVLAPSGTILAVGKGAWDSFAVENGAPGLHAISMIGRSVFEMIDGDDVRESYRRLHRTVCDRRKQSISFEYRCDSPTSERHMRMSLTPLGAAASAVLYQSQIISARPRVAMDIFSADRMLARRSGTAPGSIVTVCSYCHDVAWPLGAQGAAATWISPAAYYKERQSEDFAVSHGICPACFQRVVAPNA